MKRLSFSEASSDSVVVPYDLPQHERIKLVLSKPQVKQLLREHFLQELHENLLAHRLRAEKATAATAALQNSLKLIKLVESSGLPIGVRNTLLKRCEGQSPEFVVSLIESTRAATSIEHQPPPAQKSFIRNPEKIVESRNQFLDDSQVETMYARLTQIGRTTKVAWQPYSSEHMSPQDLEESRKLTKPPADKRRKEHSLTESERQTQSDAFTRLARRLRNDGNYHPNE